MNASLVDWLTRMQFAARVEITDRTGELALLAQPMRSPAWIPPCGSTLARHCCRWLRYTPDPADHPLYTKTTPGGLYSLTPMRWSKLSPTCQMVSGLPVRWPPGLRIAAGRPRQLVDTDDRSIPHELTGCVPQSTSTRDAIRQENVARVHNLGHHPRHLVGLLIDGSVHGLPEAGADIILRPRPQTPKPWPLPGPLNPEIRGYASRNGSHWNRNYPSQYRPEAQLIIRETPPEDAEDCTKLHSSIQRSHTHRQRQSRRTRSRTPDLRRR